MITVSWLRHRYGLTLSASMHLNIAPGEASDRRKQYVKIDVLTIQREAERCS